MGDRRLRLVVVAAAVVLLTVAIAAVAVTFVLGLGSQVSMETGQQSGAIGLAAGGAQDATAFRRNVREGYVPQPTDLTYEGLYHEYYFDTGQRRDCEQLFCPSYSRAVSRDPLSNETERYLSVGLNSGISQSEFQRPNVTMVVVMDASGSMGSSIAEYHYDGNGTGTPPRDEVETTTKIDAAAEAVATLLERLGPGDRLAVVTYSGQARVLQRPRDVSEIEVDQVRQRIRDVQAGGGTNLADGMQTARELVEGHPDDPGHSTRLVYVTDAMPNLGETTGTSLETRVRQHAESGVYTTFIGVGVDFNSRLTETVSTLRGANYYSVDSAASFRERMDEGFAYMVTPLVFDLSVRVESDAYDIEAVYGSPQAGESTAEVMSVATLFPSRREDNRTEGGVILVELDEASGTNASSETVDVVASYETRTGDQREVTRTVQFGDHDAPYYENSGVRKAVALTRYATLMRNWAAAERADAGGRSTPAAEAGIDHRTLGEWEQQSVSLGVSPPWGERIRQFRSYFATETTALGDDSMERELDVMARLLNHSSLPGTSTTTPAPNTSTAG